MDVEVKELKAKGLLYERILYIYAKPGHRHGVLVKLP
jgi:hypothetical protein